MHFSSAAALVAAALAGISNAYTQPVGANPEGNPISAPSLGQQVQEGQPFTITWEPTTPTSGTVTLVLVHGPSDNVKPLYAIAENIPNSGSYTWTPNEDLKAEQTHYGIQLIVDDNGQYQYTPQFGITKGYTNPGGPVSIGGGDDCTTTAPVAETTTCTDTPVAPITPVPETCTDTPIAPVPETTPCTDTPVAPVPETSAPCTESTVPEHKHHHHWTTADTTPCTTDISVPAASSPPCPHESEHHHKPYGTAPYSAATPAPCPCQTETKHRHHHTQTATPIVPYPVGNGTTPCPSTSSLVTVPTSPLGSATISSPLIQTGAAGKKAIATGAAILGALAMAIGV